MIEFDDTSSKYSTNYDCYHKYLLVLLVLVSAFVLIRLVLIVVVFFYNSCIYLSIQLYCTCSSDKITNITIVIRSFLSIVIITTYSDQRQPPHSGWEHHLAHDNLS